MPELPRFALPDHWRARLQPFLARPGAYLFGGGLRDFLLNRPLKDIDLLLPSPVRDTLPHAVREAHPQPVRDLLPRTSPTLVPLDEARDIWRVAWPDGECLDIKGYHDLDAEIHQSDFTVNALMLNCATGEWDDRVGGGADLAARQLRVVRDDAFYADPLRVLRAARFAAQLGLLIAPQTGALLRAAVPRLAAVARERVVDEMRLMANHDTAAAAWQLLADNGALFQVFPALTAARGCVQNHYHHLDVLRHSLAAARGWTDTVRPWLVGDAWRDYLAEPLGLWTRQGGLALALLLHDAGKPVALTVEADGRRRFHNHEVIGAEMLERELTLLGLPTEVLRAVVLLTRHHMRAGLGLEPGASDRVRRRYADLAGTWAPAGWAMAAADRLATRGPASVIDGDQLRSDLTALGEQWFARRAELQLPRLLTGADVLALGISGPRVGELLRAVREAQLEGELADRATALQRLQALANK